MSLDSKPSPLILSINAGSSSVKCTLFACPNPTSPSYPSPTPLATATVDSITAPPAKLTYTLTRDGKSTQKAKGKSLPKDGDDAVTDQASAFAYILRHLEADDALPEVADPRSIAYMTHRIVHGGSYSHMEVLNKETVETLDRLSDLAPLHNTVGLQIVRSAHTLLPHAHNYAAFDSAFHATMPRHITRYAIDPVRAERNGLRKYGFHGISYAFIARSVGAFLGADADGDRGPNIIALHLGSGASACAIGGGKSVDTSMGLTPLAGLPGGSRSGDVDPSLVFHYTHDAGQPSPSSTKEMHITTAEEILNKKSGFKALTGTADFGEITSKAASGDEACKLCFDMFVDRVLNFVGSYYVKLGGKVDALVFAGGIGEKGVEFRERVVEGVRCLGFEIDKEKNSKPADEVVADIGSKDSRHRVLICQTDEQFEMARDCVLEVNKQSS